MSTPALRCRQTVGTLSAASGPALVELPELSAAARFHEPTEWVDGVYAPMGEAVAGAWIAGQAGGALARSLPLPPLVDRGGGYALQSVTGRLTITGHSVRGS